MPLKPHDVTFGYLRDHEQVVRYRGNVVGTIKRFEVGHWCLFAGDTQIQCRYDWARIRQFAIWHFSGYES